MKIIITESQKNLLTEKISEDRLRDFCYKIWNKQKEKGEEPHLDDIIYQVSGINKNSREDRLNIRPIWYDYNGGYEKLFDRMKNDILNKRFDINEPDGSFSTQIEIIDVFPSETLLDAAYIYCNVDKNGRVDYGIYNDETDEFDMLNVPIYDAYSESFSNFESSDFEGMVLGYVYVYMVKKLEKYGIPIDVDVEIVDFN
jgi:hypothetical protein